MPILVIYEDVVLFSGGETAGMQGNSDPNLELLDAGVVVGHLVPAGSVYAFFGGASPAVVPRCDVR